MDAPTSFIFSKIAYGALGHLRRALYNLDRLPLLDSGEPLRLVDKRETEVIQQVLDKQTGTVLEGVSRHWMYATLESIRDEKKLQKVLLRLFQNSVPQYAQIRHGPMEFGKDIAVAVLEDSGVVLRLYQVKCGELKKAEWNQVRLQLEEMFQVPLESFQIPEPIQGCVGILIWNGHADPFVEPVMQGWATDQFRAFGRQYKFMHLDSMVNYILDHRLLTVLRDALTEMGVAIIQLGASKIEARSPT